MENIINNELELLRIERNQLTGQMRDLENIDTIFKTNEVTEQIENTNNRLIDIDKLIELNSQELEAV